MIVTTSDPVLRGFLRDLDAASPLPIPSAPPDLARFSTAEIDAARITWANRVADEYRGFAVFSEVLALIGGAAVGFPALAAVARVVADELRHVALCHRVVEWLGGWDDLHPDLEGVWGGPRGAGPPLTRARRLVALEMVVGEAESVPMFDAFRRAAEEGPIQRVLEIILHDEVRHAAAGRSVLASIEEAMEEAGVDLDPALADEMEATRARIRASYRRAAAGGPGRALGVSLRAEDLAGLGR
jgi:hypothetical protein